VTRGAFGLYLRPNRPLDNETALHRDMRGETKSRPR
jgi:hypothetical protein